MFFFFFFFFQAEDGIRDLYVTGVQTCALPISLRLTVFDVSPGHEGRFVNAARGAADRSAPWLLYEATDSPTFMLVASLRAAPRPKKTPPIPRRLLDVKDILVRTSDGVYTVRPHMSRPPKGWKIR